MSNSTDRGRASQMAERITTIKNMQSTYVEEGGDSCHESCLKSWHVVHVIKTMLKDHVPPDWVLTMIYLMEEEPPHKGGVQ